MGRGHRERKEATVPDQQPQPEDRQADRQGEQTPDEAERVEHLDDDEIVTDLDVDDDAEHVKGGPIDGKGNDTFAL